MFDDYKYNVVYKNKAFGKVTCNILWEHNRTVMIGVIETVCYRPWYYDLFKITPKLKIINLPASALTSTSQSWKPN